MPKRYKYVFKIDAYTPETIPLGRLAEYMAGLAQILGSPDRVHFVELQSGSLAVVSEIEREAFPKVRERVHGVKTKDAPTSALNAFQEVDNLLREDNASAVLLPPEGVRPVLKFPGRIKEQKMAYGPVNQEGSLDGVLIRIGGESDPVPVHIQEIDDKPPFICEAKRSVAIEMAPYYLIQPLRVKGEGRYFRDEDGKWTMKRFTINDFHPLKDERLIEALQRLRAIKKPWGKNPVAELLKLRGEDDKKELKP